MTYSRFSGHGRRFGLAMLMLGLAATYPASGADRVWVIGGGPDVYGSQAQIELNTRWALEVIDSLPGERDLTVWYDDGDDPAPDVSQWLAPPESAAALQPLARVLGSGWANGLVYRNHRVPGVSGSTRSDLLHRDLLARIPDLRAGDRVWLLFNGHGRREAGLDNTMELWDRSWITVSELGGLLDRIRSDVRLRFLFTQCYSGAFAALARPGNGRCGFMAEAADQEAEGCSAAIDEAAFEDYSTHFFAALAGRNRDGSALAGRPDRNRDGRVSPLEAHYHTLLTARSADIPRATSESVLLQWRPWYGFLAAWLDPGGADRDGSNRYHELARELMTRLGVVDGDDLATRRAELAARRQTLQTAARELSEGEPGTLRQTLEDALLRRWPEAGYPYTRAYRQWLQRDLDDAQTFILARPEYPRLLTLQAESARQESELLELERAIAGLDKIAHLQDLARRLVLLRTFGPEDLERHHAELLACEDAPF